MAAEGNRDKSTINLNVISPTIPPISLTGLPVTTLISELKTKIQEASPAHPPVVTQRLIYRGHHLFENKSLKDILSQEVINSNDHVTLHLVTPPLQGHVHAPQQAQPQAPQAQAPVQPPPPNAHAPPPLHHMTFSAFFNGQPVQVQPAANAPAAQSSTATGNQAQSQPVPQHEAQTGSTQQTPNNSQNVNPATQAPLGQPHPAVPLPPQFNQYMNNVQAQAQSLLANQIDMLQQHLMSGQTPFNPALQQPAAPMPSNPQPIGQAQQPSQVPTVYSQAQVPVNGGAPVMINGPLNVPPSFTFPPPQTQIHAHTRPTQPQSLYQNMEQGTAPVNPQPGHNPPAPAINSRPSQSVPMTSQSSTVYILSSPTGPQALLVSPQGQYMTPWLPPPQIPFSIPPALPQRPINVQSGLNSSLGSPTRSSAAVPGAPASPSQLRNQSAQQFNNEHRVNAAAQPENPNRADANPQQREVNRLLAQLLPNMWLMVRLFGFIWFFSHGASLTRTILLCSAATLVFVVQLGLFRNLLTALRQRAENIFQLGGQDNNRGAGRRREVTPGPQPPAAPSSSAQSGPPPTDHSEQTEGNVVRRSLRQFERATAIFLASLAPGVAERHIQAREEATRLREIQEREDRERLEREAAQSTDGKSVEPAGTSEVSESRTEALDAGEVPQAQR